MNNKSIKDIYSQQYDYNKKNCNQRQYNKYNKFNKIYE